MNQTTKTIPTIITNKDKTFIADVVNLSGLNRIAATVTIEGGSSRPAKAQLYEFTGSQTLTTILTPTSGYKLDIYFCSLTSDDSSGAKVVARFNTSNQNVFIDWTKTGVSPAQLVNFRGNTNEVLSLDVTGLPGNKNCVLYIGYDEVL